MLVANVHIGHCWLGFTGGQYSTNFPAFKPILTGKKIIYKEQME